MRVTLLGTGCSVPSAERASSGALLEARGARILIDPSAGTTQRLARAGVSPDAIDIVLISHFHADHVGDLAALLFALRDPRFDATRRWPTVIGPAGTHSLVDGMCAPFTRWLPAVGDELPVVEIDRSWQLDCPAGGIAVEARPVQHAPESLAYRVTDGGGATVVWSGDLELCDGIVELARGADLLLLECTWPRGRGVPGHLDPAGVSAVVRAAQPRQTVLVHMTPECDEVDLIAQCDADVRDRIRTGVDLAQLSTLH